MRCSYVRSVIENVNWRFCWFPANFKLMCAFCFHFIRSSREYYYFVQSPNYAVRSWPPIFDFRFLNFPCFVCAVPWLRRLFSSLLRRRHKFTLTPGHVVFVVDDMALGRVYLRVPGLCLCLVSLHAFIYSSPTLCNLGNWQLRQISHLETF